MNYDFQANWDTLIKPLLHTAPIQRAIRNGTIAYLKNELKSLVYNNHMTEYERRLCGRQYQIALKDKCDEYLKTHPDFLKYDKSKRPVYYCRNDHILNMEEEFDIAVQPKLVEAGILLPDENEPDKDKYPVEEDLENAWDEYYGSETHNKYMDYRNKVIEPYWQDFLDSDYEAYCLYGGCHWYNPTFSYTLAKMVAPTEKWRVKYGRYHTTVVNDTGDKVFDILYFDPRDETKGGAKALDHANNRIEN